MHQITRNQKIVRAGIIGVSANILLAALKAAVGLLANSIAILLDALNNLSDALSSVITIAGAKLSEKRADKKHPLGYGRIEYLSALLISGIILFAGATSFVESVKKIITPNTVTYSTSMLIVIVVAIAVKLLLGHYTKKKGIETNSQALFASGSDALFDAIVTAATLISAFAALLWHINLDGWLGTAISVVILKAGFGMLSDTLGDILGKRVSPEKSKQLKEEICKIPGVIGAYDLFLDSYGPQKLAGSVHIEVSDTMTASEISILTRKVSAVIYKKYDVVLTCGIYAVESQDKRLIALRDEITACAQRHPGVLQVHGFYIDEVNHMIFFDIILDFTVNKVDELLCQITEDLVTLHPEYHYHIQPDLDFSD